MKKNEKISTKFLIAILTHFFEHTRLPLTQTFFVPQIEFSAHSPYIQPIKPSLTGYPPRGGGGEESTVMHSPPNAYFF